MANEIKFVLNRAAEDMAAKGMLTKGTRFDIADHALRGMQFELAMSQFDALRIRSRLRYYKKTGIMHQHSLQDGNVLASFNQ